MIYTVVVLHYKTIRDTKECINSILELCCDTSQDKIHIVVVDNGSADYSYEMLKKTYQGDSNIHIIKNKENLGFARGNNVGFVYAKNKLKSDFIILLNNDTVVRQKDMLKVIYSLYERYDFAVLGPDIITADGYHQNPTHITKWTIKSLKKCRLKQRVKYIFTFFGLDKFFIRNDNHMQYKKKIDKNIVGADLHGACLIFSPIYITKFNGLCDRTFLYMEEDILKLYIEKHNMISLYSHEIEIYHKEDMATKKIHQSERKRKLSKYQQWIASSYVYEEEYRKLNGKDG